ncbi:MAG: DUF89 family protein [Spirochaetales bacterium]|nr:DUF89 family protein [Spirochaetales bacterium]
MKTYFECIPCFFKQAMEACKMINLPAEKTKAVMDAVALEIPRLDMTASPPEMAMIIYRIIREKSNNRDPYLRIKRKSNETALAVYPGLKKIVKRSRNRLLKAVEIAIAGNIIDYGALSDLDLNKEIRAVLNSEEKTLEKEKNIYFNFDGFRDSLEKAKSVFYLADNAGELVFDRILIEEIRDMYPDIKIFCAVRGYPAINDCLMQDAITCGIDRLATVVSNGSDAPGTLLESCSREFLDIWKSSDLIISKGQGNFESIADQKENIFFLFIVKCGVLARDIGCRLRDVILYRGNL